MKRQRASEIPNEKLTLENIPHPNADRFDACAAIAQANRERTLTELRITLFYNQRARRFVSLDGFDDTDPLKEDRELISKIREKIERGECI